MNPRLFLLAALLAAPALHAALPDAAPYQGRITAAGTALTGTGYFKFAVYQQSLGNPALAELLWTSATGATTGTPAEPVSAVALPVTNGLFALGLGDTAVAGMAALPASLAPAAGQRAYVRVWFSTTGIAGSFQTLSPDTELRSVPFAREAGSVAGFSTANLPQLNAANTFTNVSGLVVKGDQPTWDTGASEYVPANGTVITYNSDSRMEFIPGLAAFRAGYTTDSTQWDAAHIGLFSTAFGFATTASGQSSTAMGSYTNASGGSSTAMGGSTTASDFYTTAMGYRTTASGNSSTAMGTTTTASGDSSTAMGTTTTASGNSSTTMGKFSTANGEFSTAMGYATIASGQSSTAMGSGTIAPSYAETVIGQYNTRYPATGVTSWFAGDRLFVVGNGTSESARADAFTVYKNGDTVIAGNAYARSFTPTSDRNAKTDIIPADTAAVLAGVAALPIATWRFKEETVTHLGPMAQDFAAAFHLGNTDKGIATVDADGVALASIQELKKQLDAVKAQNAGLAEQNAALKSELGALAARLAALEAKLAK